MLEQTLAEICDAIGRCHVMRVLDVHEASVVVNGATTSSSRRGADDDVLRGCRTREKWRLSKESIALTRLQRIATDGAFHVKVKRDWQLFPSLREGNDEAAAASVGMIYRNAAAESDAAGHSLLYSDEYARLLQEAAPLMKRLSAKQVTASDGSTAALLLEKLVPLHTSESANASLRELLFSTSHQLRTFAWLWQRHIAQGGPLTPEVFHTAFKRFLEPKREEMQDLLTGASLPADARHSNVPESSDSCRPQLLWTPALEAKWRGCLRLVIRMQSCARRFLAIRRHRPAIAKKLVDKRLKRYKRVETQLVPNALQYLRRTQPVAEAYHQVVRKVEADQSELEDFYATEEQVFQQQWNQYVRKMTHFFMNECPLEQDWIAQRDPATQTIVYINVKSGRTQTENPNALKVVAAKNREWMKATRERQVRLAKASIATERVNHLKSKLLELTKKLETPVFL